MKPRKKSGTIIMNLDKFSGNIFYNISECLKIIEIVKKVEDNNIKRFLIDHLIVKLGTLFDTDSDVVSLQQFKKRLGTYLSQEAHEKQALLKYTSVIDKPYCSLIKRIHANRNKRIAHHQEVDELGWDNKTREELKRLEAMGVFLQSNLEEVPVEKQLITLKNVPLPEIENLLLASKDWIFYEILYPRVPKP